MVFNRFMQTPEIIDLELDRQRTEAKVLIDSEGGVNTLALKLDYSVQRVQNWLSRGIPADVKLEHPEVFLRHLMRKTVKA